MKAHFILIIALLGALSLSAQSIKYSDLHSEGNYTQYITKQNDTITVGDRVEIGLPYNKSEFIFLTQGNLRTSAYISGNKPIITKLKCIGKDEIGYKMFAYIKGFGSTPVIIDIEPALQTKEILL